MKQHDWLIKAVWIMGIQYPAWKWWANLTVPVTA